MLKVHKCTTTQNTLVLAQDRHSCSVHDISSLALLDCVSIKLLSWRRGPSSIRRTSVKRIFSETIKGINAKCCGKLAIHHISRYFFPCLINWDFLILTKILEVHGTLWEWKFQNATPTVLIFFQPNFFYTFPMTVLSKLACRNFGNFKFEI